MSQITLTDDQLALVPVVRDEWIKRIYDTKPTNEKEAIKGVKFLYKETDHDLPDDILFYDDPISMRLAALKALGKKPNESIQTNFNSLWDSAGWSAYFDFFKRTKILDIWKKEDKITQKDITNFDKYLVFLNANPMLSIYCDTAAFVCRSPEKTFRDNQNRPHNEIGPSLLWRNNTKMYYWHGIPIKDSRLIEQPETIDKAYILGTKNLELRRIIQEKIGNQRYVDLLNPVVIHEDNILTNWLPPSTQSTANMYKMGEDNDSIPFPKKKREPFDKLQKMIEKILENTIIINQHRRLLEIEDEGLKKRFVEVEDQATRSFPYTEQNGKRDLLEIPKFYTDDDIQKLNLEGRQIPIDTCAKAVAWTIRMRPDEYKPYLEV